jgi:hypothetical protein
MRTRSLTRSGVAWRRQFSSDTPLGRSRSRSRPRAQRLVSSSTSRPAHRLGGFRRNARSGPAFEALVRYDDQGRDVLDAEDALKVFYARLDTTTARWAASQLRPNADHGELELQGPPPVPSAFVYARHDEVFTTEGMESLARLQGQVVAGPGA